MVTISNATVEQLIAELSTRSNVVAANYDDDNTCLILINLNTNGGNCNE